MTSLTAPFVQRWEDVAVEQSPGGPLLPDQNFSQQAGDEPERLLEEGFPPGGRWLIEDDFLNIYGRDPDEKI